MSLTRHLNLQKLCQIWSTAEHEVFDLHGSAVVVEVVALLKSDLVGGACLNRSPVNTRRAIASIEAAIRTALDPSAVGTSGVAVLDVGASAATPND